MARVNDNFVVKVVQNTWPARTPVALEHPKAGTGFCETFPCPDTIANHTGYAPSKTAVPHASHVSTNQSVPVLSYYGGIRFVGEPQ